MPMQRRATPNPSMILVVAGVGEIEYPDTGPSSSGPRMGMSGSPIVDPIRVSAPSMCIRLSRTDRGP
ncbi:hypothetical protein M378DRAFT_163883 [Amanita muscaria Koide BX008]|uniref:Uncharacterized protein n=1 Tax=Amanita muscaria (strain Koide BX008) TaxID=946122 RepID=A0A0C2SL31_AMAMK|nr:hypothetical protein M378DRAFT_163883 [Amanita muscaria Koide BX008]